MDKLKLEREDIERLCYIDESCFNGEISEEDKKRIVEQSEELKRNYKGCFNCGYYLQDDWKYCPFCGTKKGEGEFNPVRNIGGDILLYGPSTTKYYKCKRCYYKWNDEFMVDEPKIKCCPNCGNKKVEMFYKIENEIHLSPRVEDIKFKDIAKYKFREICNYFYTINRKIRSVFDRNEKR